MTGESASVSCSLLEKLLEFCGGQSQKLESKATGKSVRPPWTSGMDWGARLRLGLDSRGGCRHVSGEDHGEGAAFSFSLFCSILRIQ